MVYLCRFLTSCPCLSVPRSLTKCRIDYKTKQNKTNKIISFTYLIRKFTVPLVLIYICCRVRMASYVDLSYPSSAVPEGFFLHTHYHSTTSRDLLDYVHCTDFLLTLPPLLKITKRHVITFKPKWQRLL